MSGRRRPRKAVTSSDSYEGLITLIDPGNVASESYRALRTSLLYGFVDSPPKVIVTTSPGRREGKTTTCANLGVVLSQLDNTLIVDCDLRKPTMHKVFDVRNHHGIGDILRGEYGLPDIWHEPVPKLKLLTAGPLPPNPAELLSSRRFAAFIDQARQQFDYVLVDTPPVQLVSDATIAARQSDGAVLILDAQNTRKRAVRQSVRSLEAVGARVLGTVMNNVKVSRSEYYGYTYES
jgi:capsular exopolysaccharide synthesis family protein